MENDIEQQIAKFMLTASKFEFYLVMKNAKFAKAHADKVVRGIKWKEVADCLQDKVKFDGFKFEETGFKILKCSPPQQLIITEIETSKLDWAKQQEAISSWEKLLTKGYAQLRNNVAHGNKALHASNATQVRTAELLCAGYELTSFIAETLYDERHWEERIFLR